MTCRDITERLGAYADRELDESQAAALGEHVESCRACATRLQEYQSVTGLLRAAVMEPADEAAADGRFDRIWENVQAAMSQQRPSFAERIRAWWDAQRAVLVPALAGAAAILVLGGLWLRQSADEAPPAAEAPRLVAHAPVRELPPFAPPRLAAEGRAVAEAPQPAPGRRDQPAPRRREPERMVAFNEAFIVDYEVERGTVIVESHPEEPDLPVVVWHFLEDNGEPLEEEGEKI
jgi:hypothetical protein